MIGSQYPWLVVYGNWLFRTRNTVFPLVMLALFAGFQPVLAGGNLGVDHGLNLLGLLIAASGQILRAVVIGFAYIKRGGLNKQVHADALVTEGFFAHVRNPLYAGNLLILLGLFVIHNNFWVYVLGSIFFVSAYIAIVAAEETFLLNKFGADYENYCAQVHRWLPQLSGIGDTMSGMAFNWQRVLVKDYASCYTWVMAALALMAWERVGRSDNFISIGMTAVLVTAVFLFIRQAKKSKRLRP